MEILYTFAEQKKNDVRQKIYAISRAERFSPNSVDRDAAVLDSVSGVLRRYGYDVETVCETAFAGCGDAVACLSMGREKTTVAALREIEARGVVVINGARGVETCCNRRLVNCLMAGAGIPLPPDDGRCGFWVKRADGTAEGPGDVRFAPDRAGAMAEAERMKAAGAGDVIVQAHVEGDLVKFYGVAGTPFFHFCYPGDDHRWKFGDESRNGQPRHYPFSAEKLKETAALAAAVSATDVYGGDCIVDSRGGLTVIDFNDWPSFSRCRDEAAEAIARLTVRRVRARIKETNYYDY